VEDLKMIDRLDDQRGGNPHTITGKEKKAWNHLLRRLNWRDTFMVKQGQLNFTWDNRHKKDGNSAKPWILRRSD
jgi:hypothetical protein